jgi:hypothetical protein
MAEFVCADVITWLDVTFVFVGMKPTALSSLEGLLLLLTMRADYLADGCNG